MDARRLSLWLLLPPVFLSAAPLSALLWHLGLSEVLLRGGSLAAAVVAGCLMVQVLTFAVARRLDRGGRRRHGMVERWAFAIGLGALIGLTPLGALFAEALIRAG